MGDPPAESPDVTFILKRLSDGHASAAAELLPLVYDELRELAANWFRGASANRTLQPTALVHEAYIKLVGRESVQWQGRNHFFAVAARAIRQVLIDHARQRGTSKRGGGMQRISMEQAADSKGSQRGMDVLALDEALTRLAGLDERKSQVVELRLFGGLTGEAIAAALGVSRNTVDSDWQVARAWLRSQLRDET